MRRNKWLQGQEPQEKQQLPEDQSHQQNPNEREKYMVQDCPNRHPWRYRNPKAHYQQQ